MEPKTSDEPQSPAKEIQFPVAYSSSASNLLLSIIIVIYIPLILAPLVIIPFNLSTAGVMSVLLLALAFGIYVFKGNSNKKKGMIKISPGDIRIEGKSAAIFVVSSKGLSSVNPKILKSSQASLFETRIVFENESDCKRAFELAKQYY
ncbi:MAG: hypothetical protein ACYCPW_11770 [Nitrososphaerales archaeon]